MSANRNISQLDRALRVTLWLATALMAVGVSPVPVSDIGVFQPRPLTARGILEVDDFCSR